MSFWDDVDRLASALPVVVREITRSGLAAWKVGKKAFAWEGPPPQS
jgi:hypothetical protein